MACKTREQILQDGQIVNNSDGTISVYVANPSNGQLMPLPLTKPCCEVLGQGAFFDTTTQKCRWSSNNAGTCDYNMPFNIVLNPKGNDGAIFSSIPDEVTTLSVEFDYLFKFDCDKLTEFMGGHVDSACKTLNDIFESMSATMSIDVVALSGINVVNTSVYEQPLFNQIGSGNLSQYLSGASGDSGFYICSNNAYSSGCTDLYLYDSQINNQSNCKYFVEQILSTMSGVPSNSFASNWLHFESDITDESVLSAITNEKIKLTVKISGTCIDICVLLDNIKLDRNSTKVTRNDIFLSKSPGFELDRIIDNKKSWLNTTTTTHRTFNIANVDSTKAIRYTDYYLQDERQILNTKEIDLDINIASAIETDIWDYIYDNPCLLTGTSIGTTACTKDAFAYTSTNVTLTAITSSTIVVTGNCCPVTAVTSSTVVYTSTTFSCPFGYSATPANDACERVDTIPATFLGLGPTILAGDKNGGNYSLLGAYFYPEINVKTTSFPFKYNTSSQLLDGNGTVVNPVVINNTNSFWASLGSTTNGRLNNAGILAPEGQWAGFVQCIDILVAGTYYVGIAADNQCRFYVNDTLVANFNTNILPNFRIWSVFPIYLESGIHFIRMQGMDAGVDSAFAAEVYFPPDLATLTAATTTGQAGMIFSTVSRIGTNFDFGDNVGYSCPSGYFPNTCATPNCTKLLKEDITATDSFSSVTTTGLCTDLSCVTYTMTAGTVVTTGYSFTTALTQTSACAPKIYCCSESCGDANVDINSLLTEPLSGLTTIEDFKYFITSELIDAKDRKTLSCYPTLRLLYDRYINSTERCDTTSSAFDYESMNDFSDLIGNYWVDLIEQVVPSTTIWGATKIHGNTVFDTQKFKYKSYTSFYGDPHFRPVLSPATGATCDVEVITTVIKGEPKITATHSNTYVIQMNSGSEFVGDVKVLANNAPPNSATTNSNANQATSIFIL